MHGPTPHLRLLPVLAGLLLGAMPGLALPAPPTVPTAEKSATAAASQGSATGRIVKQAKAKAGQARDQKTARRASGAAPRRPYQPLVDTVRKSSQAFGDENVSESADRDSLQDPPPR